MCQGSHEGSAGKDGEVPGAGKSVSWCERTGSGKENYPKFPKTLLCGFGREEDFAYRYPLHWEYSVTEV